MCWGGDGPLLMAGWGEDGVGKKGGCPSQGGHREGGLLATEEGEG